MTKRVTQFSALAATVLTIAATAQADIKINDNLSLSGYAAASYEYSKWSNGGPSQDSLFDASKDTPSADAVKLQANLTYKPVTGVFSLYYAPNLPEGGTKQLELLDAYVTYDAGGGVTVTGGKFLSWMGYEAFDTVNMAQITYGAPTVGALGAIPGYHSGVKVEYSDNDVGTGFALVDSAYSPNGYAKGDGELKHNAGFEAYFTYKAIKDLTLWGGVVYDTAGSARAGTAGVVPPGVSHSVVMVDIWAQYQVNKQIAIAGEITDKDGGDTYKGWDWLAFLSYSVDDKTSLVFRISGESPSGSTKNWLGLDDYVQYTIGPSYKVTDNLTVRAEYSYYDHKDTSDKNFFGVQAIFKF